jgi:hypothetical protein
MQYLTTLVNPANHVSPLHISLHISSLLTLQPLTTLYILRIMISSFAYFIPYLIPSNTSTLLIRLLLLTALLTLLTLLALLTLLNLLNPGRHYGLHGVDGYREGI